MIKEVAGTDSPTIIGLMHCHYSHFEFNFPSLVPDYVWRFLAKWLWVVRDGNYGDRERLPKQSR